MTINHENLKWTGRMALILVLVSAADGLAGLLLRKPFPWVVIIPALLPLLGSVFVMIPVLRAEKSAIPRSESAK